MSTQQGAASLFIELRDGSITAYHGTDGDRLFFKEESNDGDWSKLISFLTHDLDLESLD